MCNPTLYVTVCFGNITVKSDLLPPCFSSTSVPELLLWFPFPAMMTEERLSRLQRSRERRKPDDGASLGVRDSSSRTVAVRQDWSETLCDQRWNRSVLTKRYLLVIIQHHCRGSAIRWTEVALGSPPCFWRTNVYNRLGASVEGIQGTLAYVCLPFEDCGKPGAHLVTLWATHPL